MGDILADAKLKSNLEITRNRKRTSQGFAAKLLLPKRIMLLQILTKFVTTSYTQFERLIL